MDNNIPKDSPAFNLAAMLNKAVEFREIVEKVKTGEGLGLSEEHKVEFLKQMSADGPASAVKEVTTQFENLQKAILNLDKFKADAEAKKG